MHDGKLYLSLDDAIALALENNLDIAIARYNLNIADTDVLRARAGAPFSACLSASCRTLPVAAWAESEPRSVLARGGTNLGAGGAGAGAGGISGFHRWWPFRSAYH